MTQRNEQPDTSEENAMITRIGDEFDSRRLHPNTSDESTACGSSVPSDSVYCPNPAQSGKRTSRSGPCGCGAVKQPGERFCSRECGSRYWAKRKAERQAATCVKCGADFQALKDAVRKGAGIYCSTACCAAHATETGKFAGANNPRWLGGVSTDNMRYRRRQIERHPVEEAARRAVSREVRAGRMTRGPCEACGAERAQGHHDDYSKPLDVRWLCRPCHDEHHRIHRR